MFLVQKKDMAYNEFEQKKCYGGNGNLIKRFEQGN